MIANGGAATFLRMPVANPDRHPALPVVVSAEDAGVSNRRLTPGERLTVNLPLVNVGTANTTNLVATLQANAGVIQPSAPAPTMAPLLPAVRRFRARSRSRRWRLR